MTTDSNNDQMAPQQDVITLADAMSRTNNWREEIKQYFNYDEDNVPRGFVIPLQDLQELVKNYQKMGCVGVRAYFTLKTAENPGQPLTNEISAILVPVTIDKTILPYKPTIYSDIIVPVPSNLKDAVSVYDVTRPCPPLCDSKSALN